MAHALHLPGTMSNRPLLAQVAALDALGIDTDQVLRQIGLTRAQFADPSGRVALGIELPLWDATIAQCGDPAIGLRAGQRISFDLAPGLGSSLRASLTGRALLEQAGDFIRQIDDLARIESREEGDRVIVRIYRSGGHPIPGPAIDCFFAAITCVMLRFIPRPSLREATMRIAHRPIAALAVYEQYLGCKVELDAPQNELDAPVGWLDLCAPSPSTEHGALPPAEPSFSIERAPQSDVLLQNARAQLRLQLDRGDTGLAALARALHLSERTLRRRLAERGTSYQAMLDELRASLACRLVAQATHSVDLIASKLGFADTSSFFHAFKRWTGKTPAQFRREQRSER